jgi:hypothetical protein
MAMVGLDLGAVEGYDGALFEAIRQRCASWAMIVVCALVTMQWFVLGSLDSAFWANSVYSGPPIVFALLTIASLVVAKVRAT